MRKTVAFTVSDIPEFKNALLNWAQKFNEIVWLDSNAHVDKYGSFDGLLAVDGLTSITSDAQNAFNKLSEYRSETKDWLFGYLSYDLKNDVEELRSDNFDGLQFPDLFFFQPKKIIRLIKNRVDFIYLNEVKGDIEADYKSILGAAQLKKEARTPGNKIRIKLRIFKDDYFRRVDRMLQHIHLGNIYEANFCQEFYAEDIQIDALHTYQKLNAISKAPFATFLKLNDMHLLSATPERYLKKSGSKVISQPIKGTAKRSSDVVEDAVFSTELKQDAKERSENIMIVDLVRNDLSKSAEKGSVKIKELCEVYTFEQVHQMISTVTSLVSEGVDPVEIIRDTFPMGSMTGAPKISAMKIIEELESFKRGLYSGAVGYFTPQNDFDFNVVIRSILYNASEKYVSFAVGSAITAQATPEREYEECLLKARAMREVLEG